MDHRKQHLKVRSPETVLTRSILTTIVTCTLAASGARAETVLIDGFDSAHEAWAPGARAEKTLVKNGDAALAWDTTQGARIERTDLPPIDLARYNTLRLWIHASSATFARVLMTIPTEAGEAFNLTFKVDWTGWNEMHIPETRFRYNGENRAQAWSRTQGIKLEIADPGFEPGTLVLDQLEQTTDIPVIPISDDETLIDWLYFSAENLHLWKPTPETAQQPSRRCGKSPFWSWGTFWVREDPEKRDRAEFERTFNTDISGAEALDVRFANDSDGFLSVHLNIDGTWQTPMTYRKGTGRFQEIALPLPADAKVLRAVRLDLSEPPDNIGGPAGRELKCNIHWLLLRRRGAPQNNRPAGIPRIEERPLNGPIATHGLPGGVYFDATNLANVRELFTNGPGRSLWERTRKQADSYLGAVPESWSGTYYPGGNWVMTRVGQKTFSLGGCARLCALAYVITGEKAYADLARRALLSLCSVEHWTDGPFARFPLGWGGHGNPFSESSITYDAGLAFDWIYNALSPDEQAQVADAILHKGIRWTVDKLQHNPSILNMNQGIVFDAQIGCALIALQKTRPDTENMRRNSRDWIWKGIDAYSLRDGASTEGVGYWNYTWNSAVKLLAALAQQDPEGFRRRIRPNVARCMDWLVHMKSNAAESFVPVFICDSRGGPPGDAVAGLFAKFLHDPTAAWFQRMAPGPSTILGAFMWEHDTPAKTPPMIPARHFRGAGYVFMREGFSQGDTLFALLGQPRLAGHYQHDRTAFILEAFGDQLAMDPGMMAYSNPLHRSMADTRLHNAITIDGADNTHSDARVTRFFASPLLDCASVDGTKAYPPAKRLQRTAFLLRPNRVVIHDTVLLKKPGRIEWNLNSAGQLSLNGTRLLARAQNADMAVDFATPRQLAMETEQWPCGYPGITNHHATLHTGSKSTSAEFLVSLCPVRKGQAETVQAQNVHGDGCHGIVVSRDDEADWVVVNSSGDAMVRCGNLETDGRYAVIRFRGSRVVGAAVIDGTLVAFESEPILQASERGSFSLDLRNGWAAASFQAPPGTLVTLPWRNGVEFAAAQCGSVSGRYSPCTVTRANGATVIDVPEGEPPQGGLWYLFDAAPEQVGAVYRTAEEKSPEILIDGQQASDGAVLVGKVPDAILLRNHDQAVALPESASPEFFLNGVPLPPEAVHTLNAQPDGNPQIRIGLTGAIPPDMKEPDLYTTFELTWSTRDASLWKRRISGRFSFAVRPIIPDGTTYLSDIYEEPATPDAPTLVGAFAHGGLIRDRAYTQAPPKLGATAFPKALTTHPEIAGDKAYADVVFDLTRVKERAGKTFKATVGVQNGSAGSVVFRVETRQKDGDWIEQALTETMTAASRPVGISVPLNQADYLRLSVTDADDGISSDHAVWAMPRIE